MKMIFKMFVFVVVLCVGVYVYVVGVISVQNVWVCWLLNKLFVGGYVMFVNMSDKLVDFVDVDSFDYGMVMLYQMVLNGLMQKMEMVDKLMIFVCGKVDIVLGGYYFMFEELKYVIKLGDIVYLCLKFFDGEMVDVLFFVKLLVQMK